VPYANIKEVIKGERPKGILGGGLRERKSHWKEVQKVVLRDQSANTGRSLGVGTHSVAIGVGSETKDIVLIEVCVFEESRDQGKKDSWQDLGRSLINPWEFTLVGGVKVIRYRLKSVEVGFKQNGFILAERVQ